MAKEPISLSSATATTTTTTTSSVDDRKTSKVDLSWTRQWFCLKGGTLYQFSSRDVVRVTCAPASDAARTPMGEETAGV